MVVGTMSSGHVVSEAISEASRPVLDVQLQDQQGDGDGEDGSLNVSTRPAVSPSIDSGPSKAPRRDIGAIL